MPRKKMTSGRKSWSSGAGDPSVERRGSVSAMTDGGEREEMDGGREGRGRERREKGEGEKGERESKREETARKNDIYLTLLYMREKKGGEESEKREGGRE